MHHRRIGALILGLASVAWPAGAQPPRWNAAAAAYTYFVPDGSDYVQPTLSAERGWLHLEARYNYEGQQTGSVWGGYAWSGGSAVAWVLTPMIGGVFGANDGVAPGYNGSLAWRAVELYSEGEYVVVPADSAEDFFYNWSQATWAPIPWLRLGLVAQRTRAYGSDRDIQRGPLIGVARGRIEVNGQLFNPDEEHPTFVLSVRVSLR